MEAESVGFFFFRYASASSRKQPPPQPCNPYMHFQKKQPMLHRLLFPLKK